MRSSARTNDRSRWRGPRGRARRVAGGARDGARRRDCASGSPSSSPRSTTARSTTAPSLLEQVLELGLQAGRIRAYYGPGGEQAALKTLRRLPRGRARAESAREVSEALAALEGNVLERLSLTAVAPGSYILSVHAGGLEAVPARRRLRRPARERGRVSVRHYMVCLDLRGRSCLVVGGGRVALEKAQGLLECEADVTLVAPAFDAELDELPVDADAPSVSRLGRRPPVPRHCRDERPSRQLAASRAAAGERGIPCNVADDPELCSFILPAIVRRDPIAVGRLDRRRVARSRAAAARRHRRARDRASREARRAPARPSAVGEASSCRATRSGATTSRSSLRRRSRERRDRRRRPRRSGADHRARARARARLGDPRLRPARLARARRAEPSARRGSRATVSRRTR